MRVVLLSDIHANLEALEACLDHARANGVDSHALPGAFVGYGADAAGVVETVMRLANDGSAALKGNHDAAIERADSSSTTTRGLPSKGARRTLPDAHKRFLAALPLTAMHTPITQVHAGGEDPQDPQDQQGADLDGDADRRR